VPDDYPTIQQAINAASSGSVVLVSSGIYHEHVIVNKSLRLLGDEKTSTIIDSDNNGTAITVIADNVVIDGFTVRNSSYVTTGTKAAIYLVGSNNCTLSNNILTHNACYGIYLEGSDSNNVSGNLASFNGGSINGDLPWGGGVGALESNYNLIQENVIVGSLVDAILLENCSNNLVFENTITDCDFRGIDLWASKFNRFYLNSIFNATVPVSLGLSSDNVWDDGARGNYWDDYLGLDNGSDGRVAGDGVGDTDIPHHGVDSFPIVRPLVPIPVTWDNEYYNITLQCNSTFAGLRFRQMDKKFLFKVAGPSNTTGYFNITIPTILLEGNPWTVKLNGTDVTQQVTISKNQTHASVYLAYEHSSRDIQLIGTSVIPEYQLPCILALMILLTAMFAFILKTGSKRRLEPSIDKC
jgi:parallel beta-helix repeat protein